MKKRFFPFLALAAILALPLCALSGCGAKDSPNTLTVLN